ncbi:hypothetical protein [Actinomadura kijaniata]|uniref:hypothetical protein n=1 Tax=Actinomadura kijaniata TaxID=46161 RepID=UPI0008351663|nr:hypothetical protein [Actinomadura kijaniata]
MIDRLAAPDEDALVLPEGWARNVHPRRGGLPGDAAPPRPAARRSLAGLIERTRPSLVIADLTALTQ